MSRVVRCKLDIRGIGLGMEFDDDTCDADEGFILGQLLASASDPGFRLR